MLCASCRHHPPAPIHCSVDAHKWVCCLPRPLYAHPHPFHLKRAAGRPRRAAEAARGLAFRHPCCDITKRKVLHREPVGQVGVRGEYAWRLRVLLKHVYVHCRVPRGVNAVVFPCNVRNKPASCIVARAGQLHAAPLIRAANCKVLKQQVANTAALIVNNSAIRTAGAAHIARKHARSDAIVPRGAARWERGRELVCECKNR